MKNIFSVFYKNHSLVFKGYHNLTLWKVEFSHAGEQSGYLHWLHLKNPGTSLWHPKQRGKVLCFGPRATGASFKTISPAFMSLVATRCLMI